MGVPIDAAINSSQSSAPRERRQVAPHRKVEAVPSQLLDQCTVCIEEQLFTQGISLLASVLTSGQGICRPALVPPPQHLSLLATLSVHPSLTTRTTSKDRHAAADAALQYLRHLQYLTNVDESGLSQALTHQDTTPSRSKRAKLRHNTDSDEDSVQSGSINSPYAGKESLFSNADDFWAVVGWALNCSVKQPARWARWKHWLEMVLDVLESDLEDRDRRDPRTVDASLLAHYLAQYADQGRNIKRRIMRAILADGSQTSVNQFPEIWRNETRPPKVKSDEVTGSKKRKLDLEQGEFGDYLDSDSDRDSPLADLRASRNATRTPSACLSTAPDSASRHASPTADSVKAQATYGGESSIAIRKRLLAVLACLAASAPDLFLDTEDLFDLYTEFLRPLPLPVFTSFMLPSAPWLDANTQSSLIQMLLRPLLSSAAPVYNANALTQDDFETHYALFAANGTSAVENARVAVLIEGLLRLLWETKALDTQPSSMKRLQRAVMNGCKVRRDKVSWDGRKKSGLRAREEEDAMAMIELGEARMVVILETAG
nr:hypothetical protein B0A51_18080 [Rachicladosporium sp. CCFEE 5018]